MNLRILIAAFLPAIAFSQAPAFEVASIRPASPSAERGGRAGASGNRVTLTNTTLKNALARAYQVKFANQVEGPMWITTERYDIAAKAPDNTPASQIPAMLRALLIERFNLALHQETRPLPGYALSLRGGTLKIRKASSDNPDGFAVTDGRREAKRVSMPSFAQFLSLTLQAPVIDSTGLDGFYSFPYEYSREETLRDSAPSIFTIVDELGLKLESRKVRLEIIVVDGGNKTPAEN